MTHHPFTGLLAIHEAFRNGIRCEDFIPEQGASGKITFPRLIKHKKETRSRALPLSELLEDNAVWKALSAYTNPLQHAITPQLIQNQVGVKFTGLQEKNEFDDYYY